MDTISLIFSIIGTIVGTVGLIISIVTLKNTSNIKKALIKEQIKTIYPSKHKEFVNSIKLTVECLDRDERKYFIVGYLIKSCRNIQAYYDNWDNKQKALVKKFLKYLEKIPDQDINDKTKKEILKKLYKIQPQVERIGELIGIRQI